MSNCDFVAGRSRFDWVASRLALRAPALRAATALTRRTRSRSGYRAVARCLDREEMAQTTSSRTIALSAVIILRMTATITTFGTCRRRSADRGRS